MSQAPPIDWTGELTETFLQIVIDEIAESGIAEGHLRAPNWTKILIKLNLQTGLTFAKAHLHSKLQNLKKKYSIFMQLKNCSGFGWDPVAQVPTAPDDVWMGYLSHHKEAAQFRYQTIPFLDLLTRIFDVSIGRGEHAETFTSPSQQQDSGVDVQLITTESSQEKCIPSCRRNFGLDSYSEEIDNEDVSLNYSSQQSPKKPIKKRKREEEVQDVVSSIKILSESIDKISTALQHTEEPPPSSNRTAVRMFQQHYASLYPAEDRMRISNAFYNDVKIADLFVEVSDEEKLIIMQNILQL